MDPISSFRLTFTENGDDTGGSVEVSSYADLQATLSAKIAEHITHNPQEHPIEVVTIKWRAPLEREYRYVISAEKPAPKVTTEAPV